MKNRYKVFGDVVEIYLDRKGGGEVKTLISKSDLKKLHELPTKWCLCRKKQGDYVTGICIKEGKAITYQLHRYIMSCPKGLYVDHINGDGLNNTRENLRIVTCAENMQNRRGLNSNSSSGVRGVSYDVSRGKWQVKFRKNYTTIHFGRYKSFEEAVRVANEKQRELFPFQYIK